MAPDTRLGSPRSLRHPRTLPHSLPKHACLTHSPQRYLLGRLDFPQSLQKHAPTTPGLRARFRLHSRYKHAHTHCRACQNTARTSSLPPRALESRVPAPCSPDAPLPHSLSRPREHACCPHARPPARAPASALAPPPRTYSLGRGSTVVTLGPPGAQPPVPGSPPRPAPPESLHSTRRRWNDALGSGYRGLPATARVRCHGQWRGAAVSSPGPAPPSAPRAPIEVRYVTRSRAEAGVGRGAARRADCAGTAPSLAASRWTASGRAWRASLARGAAWGPSRRPVLAAAPSASSLDAPRRQGVSRRDGPPRQHLPLSS